MTEAVLKVWMPVIATGTGAEVYADRLAEQLTAKGHEVSLQKAPHRFQYAPWFSGLRPPADADVVFANSWSARAFAGKLPLVTVVHHVATDPAGDAFKTLAQRCFHQGFVKPMELAALRRSQRVVAVSATTAGAIDAHLSPTATDVVPPGIDIDFFAPDPGAQPSDPNRTLQLLFVGKPSFRKGFDLVHDIVAKLDDRVALTCVGDPPDAGLPKPKAVYTGRINDTDLRDLYRRSDLLLFPSRLEGFGYVAAEALACGLPVVCTKGTAVEETCGEGPHTITAPAGDTGGFCKAIVSAWAAEPGLATARQTARDRAGAFSNAIWADAMERILRDAIKGKQH